MTETDYEPMVFWVPGSFHIEDFAILVDGQWITQIFKTPMADLQAKSPTVKLISFSAFMKEHDAMARVAPFRISEETYWQALEVLPPEDFSQGNGAETFKMMERYSGNFTQMYLKRGKQFWQMRDDFRTSHREICAKVDAEITRATEYVTTLQAIGDLNGARLYLQALVNADLSHQLDEPAYASLSEKLTEDQCDIIDHNVAQIYSIRDVVEKHDCPIGLLIELDPDR